MVDINCDLGEGLGNESLIMPFISSCNISCGAHAGSVETMDKVIALALAHKVKIGAHPSFPDRENFGRKVLDMSHSDLQQSLVDQLVLFKERASLQGAKIHHIKPHGALYNSIAVNSEKAAVVIAAIQHVFEKVKLYAPHNSVVEKMALRNNFEVVCEAFIDRNYNNDLTLVSREMPNAVITDKHSILKRLLKMSETSLVTTVQCCEKKIRAATFCLHGDTDNAVEILAYLHRHLKIGH